MSRRPAMTMVQAAALFGLATAVRNGDRTDMYGFADGQFRVERSATFGLVPDIEAARAAYWPWNEANAGVQ